MSDPSYYPRNATIAAVFAATAATHSERPAITFGTETLSYAALNARANRLAHALRRAGAGPDVFVGVAAERSLDMIVALLAVVKAGAAYLPLDPDYPPERVGFIVSDARAGILAGPARSLSRFPVLPGLLTIPSDTGLDAEPTSDPDPLGSAASAAYVMYTSGSTGKPKGVVAQNRGVIRLVRDQSYCRFAADETWLHFAPLAFDASTLEIWGALLNGGHLVIAPERASLSDLGRLIQAHGITALWLTSGLFNVFAEQQLECLSGVRQLLAGGDVLSPRHVRRVLDAVPGITVINGYGPTENTTFTCCHAMRPGDIVPEPIPVGRPLAHTTVYILDEAGHPVTEGAEGELVTGGDGVARGYLNSPELTAEKFVPDPFSSEPGARMYRTGDLARWRKDGTVEFIGRVDNQVKILGHRIELGEIETVLSQHPAVAQSCIIAHGDGTGPKRLIAYYIATGGELTPAELRVYLTERLPRFMIPALLVPMCAMPLNANGKIDRAALPKPDAPAAARPLVSDDLPLEGRIMDIWSRATSTSPIGLDDNFFDIGGDSLRLISVHSELERALGREIPIMDLFEATTIRQLAKKLSTASPTGTPLARASLATASIGAVTAGPALSQQQEKDQSRAAKQRAAFAMRRPPR